jgi:hypothetical protein
MQGQSGDNLKTTAPNSDQLRGTKQAKSRQDGEGRQHPSAPGLSFTGYRTELSGQMRLMRFDARALA